MSGKKRAIGDTEDEFQAALATYTKAGNKMIAMRRLWNAAYEIGKSAGDDAVFEGKVVKYEPVKDKKMVKEARQLGREEGRKEGFEAGRQAGEKDALTMDAFQVSFSAGRTDGIATGMEMGRDVEARRWKDNGHFEDGTCRAVGIMDSSPPHMPPPLDNATAAVLNWADDVESLPIHSPLVTPLPPRDFSGLRSGSSTNPFDTLQRRQARYYGAQTRGRRPRRPRFHTTAAPHHGPYPARLALDLAPRSRPSVNGCIMVLGLLAWVWTMLHWPLKGFGLGSAAGNEDVALRRGADALVRTERFGGVRAD
ncbi:hypothetical protein B0H15DRAFT_848417 [Mycena belliarum]|uniref:Uncharacterized protein n=1 Tax=Mycena belliarum TaxID=1033014 RepID=A0AAD6XP69_9AGAR|nr:hypothetical protein B0H15DRAFT_848417 [Mycena belliae]